MIELLPLMPYLCTGMYTSSMYNKVSNGNHDDLDRFLKFCKFKLFEHLFVCKFINNDLQKRQTKNQHISFQVKNDNYILYIYNFSSFTKLFKYKNMVVRPIYCNINNNMHIMIMIIDNKHGDVYIYDPNNDIKNIKYIENNIITLFDKHKCKSHKVNSVDNWNKISFIMNKISYKSPIYFKGHCVITSLLMVHYMALIDKPLNICIDIFNKIDEETLLTIINNYSLFYYLFVK